MNDIVAQLRSARQIPHVALQQYIILRSKAANDLVCVFEGFDDHPFYDTIFRRFSDNLVYRPLIANGKDQVLGLRELLVKRRSPLDQKVAYFIDKDFDGYKSYMPSKNTYCTNGYSIENNLCATSVLTILLETEYSCHKTDEEACIPNIIETFNLRLVEFAMHMRQANKVIHFARQNGVRLRGIENQITKYLNITLKEIKPTTSDHLKLIGWPEDVSVDAALEPTLAFDSLAPMLDWRGKFVLGVYLELLNRLKDDRCSTAPVLFKTRNKIKFNPKGDILRTLALLAPAPSCLRDFVAYLDELSHSNAITA